MIMNPCDPALELMSQKCVGASPPDANQEEKDLLDPGSANNTRMTPALVQLCPGEENTKELPDITNLWGKARHMW